MFNERRARWTALALLLARCVLGLIFLMAGLYKVFTLTPIGHAEKFFLPFADTFLPVWSLWAVGCTVPFVELLAGALVLIGWGRSLAYLSLGAVLVLVTFGHLLHDALYPFHEHVIPRLALLLLLLIMPPEADRWSVDELVARRTLRRHLAGSGTPA
jgi:uncharacterized membrane protein YphA (DoxX/SURF4 family)